MALTKEHAIEVMKQRGYTLTSEAGNGKWIGFSRDMNGIWLSAKVFLETEDIEINGGVLKMGCELKVNKFSFTHQRFDEFEKWLYFYGKVCSEIDTIVENLDFIPQRLYMANSEMPSVLPAKEIKKDTLEDRIKKFKKNVIEIGKDKGYSPAMCKKFFDYWSEVNQGGKKMRWEIAKSKGGVFNIERRLVTWAGKDQEYNARFLDRDEKKAAKQNEELKQETKKASKKELF